MILVLNITLFDDIKEVENSSHSAGRGPFMYDTVGQLCKWPSYNKSFLYAATNVCLNGHK